MHLLQVSGIRKKDERGFELNDIHFTQLTFQQLAIAGETGSGKTTLLKIIAGLAEPDGGEVLFEGKKVTGPNYNLIPGHPGIAYLSQQFELPNHLRVEQVLEYANELSAEGAHKIFDLCRISHLLKRRTNQLSGGERQRIAIARLLIGSPRLFLLDEPFSNMDMIHKTMLQQILKDIGEQLRISFIMISHDPLELLSWADQVLIMKDGTILQHGTPQEVYNHPVNEYVAGLLGRYNLIPEETAISLQITTEIHPGKRLFTRPEDLHISPAPDPSHAGHVNEVLFCGSYDELDITYMNTRIYIRTQTGMYSKHANVDIKIPPKLKWWI